MQRANAYMALAAELEMWSRRPSSDLLACVGLPATSRVVEVQGEALQLELTVSWTNEKRLPGESRTAFVGRILKVRV